MFVKGQSGNPGGRPKKGTSFSDVIRAKLDEEVVIDGKPTKNRDAISQKLINMAIGGDIAALKYCMDRMEGTPKQSIDMGVQEGPLGFDVEFTDEGTDSKEV